MTAARQAPERATVLDPIDRTSKVLFGLFMVLTFTGTLSVANAGRDDLRGAAVVFALVVASTFPPVLPFVFLDNLPLAMRVSAAVAIAMLFISGYGWGRYAGLRPARVGLVMVALGIVVQAVVIALGG